jgi:hypothetical protein
MSWEISEVAKMTNGVGLTAGLVQRFFAFNFLRVFLFLMAARMLSTRFG